MTRVLGITVLTAVLGLALCAPAQGKVVKKTFSSGDLAAALPAGTGAGLSVFSRGVKVKGKIKDVDVSVRISNTNPNTDRKITLNLRSPLGEFVGLTGTRPGAGYGTGASSCAGTPTIFDDEASIAWADPAAASPFPGPHRPNNPLTVVDGSSPKGVWDLLITSNYGSIPTTSTLDCWSLTITYKAPKKKKKKK